jgi:hypothetical protein
MIVPSDNWCISNGYMLNFSNQGATTTIPDYKSAFQKNSDLTNVISKINGLMSERGFTLKNMESVIKSVEADAADVQMLTSKSGSDVSETPFDKIKNAAKADIVIQLGWSVNKSGFNKSVTFNMQGLDAYTNKQIATAQGTGSPSSSADIIVLLQEAVLANIDNFNATLQSHFDDLFLNGREINLRIRKFDSWGNDLETEFSGKELGEIIEEWLSKNTTDATESMMFFEQVRIPMTDESGKAVDARSFTRNLQNYLKSTPYNIVSKLTLRGLGQASLILGEK